MNTEITDRDPADDIKEILADVWNRCMSADEAADKLDDIISAAVEADRQQRGEPVNHPEDGLAMVKPVIPSNSGELKPAASAEPVVSDINDLIERVLDAQQDLNLEANMQMSQTLCSVSAMLDDVEDALRRFAALAQQPSGQSQRQPDGYAYRYRSTFGDGTVIRFNRGEEVNGSRPIDAVPFWYAPPDCAQDREDATADWMTDDSRAPWAINSLKDRIKEIRASEKRCRNAFKKDYMRVVSAYFADALCEAAEAFEKRLAAIDQARAAKVE